MISRSVVDVDVSVYDITDGLEFAEAESILGYDEPATAELRCVPSLPGIYVSPGLGGEVAGRRSVAAVRRCSADADDAQHVEHARYSAHVRHAQHTQYGRSHTKKDQRQVIALVVRR